MDTSLPQNSDLVAGIKQEVLTAGLFETYMESAPQFVIQCIFILESGSASEDGLGLPF